MSSAAKRQRSGTGFPDPMCIAALKLYDLGWSIIPLCDPNHGNTVSKQHRETCERPGKQPVIKWKEKQTERWSDQQIAEWWDKHPTHNVGVICGLVSKIVMVDIDSKKGRDAWYDMMGPNKCPTWEFGTHAERKRLVYAWNHAEPPNQRPFPGLEGHLDFLGEGHYTVAPPSVHKSGERYFWLQGGPGSGMPLREAPLCLLGKIRGPVGGAVEAHTPTLGVATAKTIDRAQKWADAFEPAIQGQGGNNVAFRLACSLTHGFGLSVEDAAWVMMGKWNLKCQPPWSPSEIERICLDAFHKGSFATIEERPRTPLPPPPAPAQSEQLDPDFVSGVDVGEGVWEFFYPPFIPKGVPTLLTGRGGVGKSTFQGHLATMAKRTLFMPGEEDPEKALKPRLKALGIPDKRWNHVLPGPKWYLPENLDALARNIRIGGFDLVIADPMCDYVRITATGDPRDAIADFLRRLTRMCKEMNLAFVMCRNSGKDKNNVVSGNRAWRDVNRCIIELVKDPGPPVRYIMRPEKYQIGHEPSPRYYSLVVKNGKPPVFVLGKGVDEAEAEMAKDAIDRIDRVTIEEACCFLKQILDGGPMDSRQVYDLGEKQRFSPTTLRKASLRLGVNKTPSGSRAESKSLWTLPPSDPPAGDGGEGGGTGPGQPGGTT